MNQKFSYIKAATGLSTSFDWNLAVNNHYMGNKIHSLIAKTHFRISCTNMIFTHTLSKTCFPVSSGEMVKEKAPIRLNTSHFICELWKLYNKIFFQNSCEVDKDPSSDNKLQGNGWFRLINRSTWKKLTNLNRKETMKQWINQPIFYNILLSTNQCTVHKKIIQIKQHTGPGMVCYLYPPIMFLCSLF